ncbi:MAG: hypothetical protein AAFU79_00550 [Myxococcota bacterium]
MAALTEDTPRDHDFGVPALSSGGAAANAVIYYGAAVARDAAGNLKAADGTAADKVIGVMRGPASMKGQAKRAGVGIDNTGGAAGDIEIELMADLVFSFENSGTNPVDATHVGELVYFEDDNTVSSDNTDSKGGILDRLEGGRAYVLVGKVPSAL